MEQPSCSKLKCSLSSVSAKALNASSRQILGALDHHQPLRSPKGYARDYRGLAELMGFQCQDVKRFEEYKDRSTKILEAWETRPDSTLDKLIGHLEDMDRYDVINDLTPRLENCVTEYQETPVQFDEVSTGLRKRALTRDDRITGECTMYDAFLAYDDDDTEEAFEIAQKLESTTAGLMVYIRLRDDLAGNFEFETLLEMIMNRCRRMLMIFTPNFIRNPTLEFQVNFAAKLGVERNERILIPLVVKPCGIPPILRNVSKIVLYEKYSRKTLWDNLVLSILPEDGEPFSLLSLERGPLNKKNMISNSACSASEDID